MAAASLLLISCGSSQGSKQQATGIAYTGPAAVNLRQDLGPRAATVETVPHGERLEVLETRRRFVKVRTAKGTEGWTDANYLLTQEQVSDLDRLAEFAARLPSQGAATVYDALNVHIGPNRQAPSFAQVAEGGVIQVLSHRVTPRAAASAAAPKKAKAKPAPTGRKTTAKQAKNGGTPPPPAPPPPGLPANWMELSRPGTGDLPGSAIPAPVRPAVIAPAADDWYLVRTHDGKAGWVLARQVLMSIPDEVAQYAEGRTITSYVSLGKVADKNRDETPNTTKDNWLWTTSSAGLQPYDFDSFRVFVWSVRRRHYETAYIERNVKGHYPVEAHDLPGQDEKAFSVVLEDKDGRAYKRTYAFSGYRVRMVSKTPFLQPPPVPEVRTAHNFDESPPPEEPGWSDKLGERLKRWFSR